VEPSSEEYAKRGNKQKNRQALWRTTIDAMRIILLIYSPHQEHQQITFLKSETHNTVNSVARQQVER